MATTKKIPAKKQIQYVHVAITTTAAGRAVSVYGSLKTLTDHKKDSIIPFGYSTANRAIKDTGVFIKQAPEGKIEICKAKIIKGHGK